MIFWLSLRFVWYILDVTLQCSNLNRTLANCHFPTWVAFVSTATRFSVYVINYVEDKSDTKVLTPKKDEPMSIDCMCAVSDTRVSVTCCFVFVAVLPFPLFKPPIFQLKQKDLELQWSFPFEGEVIKNAQSRAFIAMVAFADIFKEQSPCTAYTVTNIWNVTATVYNILTLWSYAAQMYSFHIFIIMAGYVPFVWCG